MYARVFSAKLHEIRVNETKEASGKKELDSEIPVNPENLTYFM